jgi:hypothetical protein
MQGLQALDQFKNFVSSIGGLGRYEDTYMVHAAEGETVVPMEVLDKNPLLKKRLFKTMVEMGIEPGRYIVGNELNSKNPVTGQPEFFLKQVGRRLRKAAADISGYAAPIVGAMYGPAAGAAVGGALGQYKRENPGDPNQALRMALLGGASGVASNIAGGQGIFKGGLSEGDRFGTGLEGFTKMLKSPFTTGGRKELAKYLQGFKMPFQGELSEGELNLQNLQKKIDTEGVSALTDTEKDNFKFLKSIYGDDVKKKGLGTLGSLGTLAGGLALTGVLGSQIPKPQDAVIDPSKIRQPERTDDFAFAPNQTYTRPEAPSAFVPTTLAAKGGVMDLQDGGESKGPGTGTSDSIPAMLSDGEFVMTAKAVRGAGGGDRREGARKMYEAMDKLEAQA